MRTITIFAVVLVVASGALLTRVVSAEVVVIVSANAPVATLSAAQVSDIFLGKTASFPGGGAAIPIDQADGSEIRQEFYARVTRKSPQLLKAYWSKLIFTGQGEPPREVMDRRAIRKLVAGNPSFIGYIESDAVDASVKIVLTPP